MHTCTCARGAQVIKPAHVDDIMSFMLCYMLLHVIRIYIYIYIYRIIASVDFASLNSLGPRP